MKTSEADMLYLQSLIRSRETYEGSLSKLDTNAMNFANQKLHLSSELQRLEIEIKNHLREMRGYTNDGQND